MNTNNNTDKHELHLNVRDGRSPYKYVTVDGQLIREHRHVMEQVLGRKLKPNEVVHHKDGNKKNNSPDNLEVLEWSEHSREHYHKRAPGKTNCVQLTCYAEDGTLIKIYESYAEAYKDGHCYDPIRDCVRGLRETYHDMVWVASGKRSGVDHGRAVHQVDPETGKILATFETMSVAARETNHSLWSISKCCKGLLVTHDGYFWVYADEPDEIQKRLEAYSHLGQKPRRPVDVYDAYTGDYLESYEQIADAVRVHPEWDSATVFSICAHEGKYASHKQRIWRFKDDPTPVVPTKQLLVAVDEKTGELRHVYRKAIDAKRVDHYGESAVLQAVRTGKHYKRMLWSLKFAYELPTNYKDYMVASAPSSIGPERGNRVILQKDAVTGKPLAVYARITDAVAATGLDRTSIGGCCRGDRGPYAGFDWIYIKPDDIPVDLPKEAIHLPDQKSS